MWWWLSHQIANNDYEKTNETWIWQQFNAKTFLFTSFKTDNKIQLKTQNETQNIEKIELENKVNSHTKTLFQLAAILQIGSQRISTKANTRYLSMKIQLTHILIEKEVQKIVQSFSKGHPLDRGWASNHTHTGTMVRPRNPFKLLLNITNILCFD